MQARRKCGALFRNRYSALNRNSSLFFWGLTPCCIVEVQWRFGETSSLYFQGPRINEKSKGEEKHRLRD
jgi:hypothetical protein